MQVSAGVGEGEGVWALKNIQKHLPKPTRNRKGTRQHCQGKNTRLTASAVADMYMLGAGLEYFSALIDMLHIGSNERTMNHGWPIALAIVA